MKNVLVHVTLVSPGDCSWVFQPQKRWLLSSKLHTPPWSTEVPANVEALHVGDCRTVTIIIHHVVWEEEHSSIFRSLYYRFGNNKDNYKCSSDLFIPTSKCSVKPGGKAELPNLC